MSKVQKRTVIGLMAAMLVASACSGAEEQAASDTPEVTAATPEAPTPSVDGVDIDAGYAFFAENNIEISLAVDPGGGMDRYARAIASGLARQFGNQVNVTHRPGAGGSTVGNWLTSNSGDATTLTFNRVSGWVLSQLTGDPRVAYDIAEWNAVGRVVAEPRSITVGAHTGIQTLEEMVTTPGLRFGSTSLGGGDWVDATVVIRAFGMDAEVIAGFDGSGATQLAVIRGDVDAQTGSPASRLGAEQAGDVLQIGAIGSLPEVTDVVDINRVTLASDLDALLDGDEGRLLLRTHSNIIALGRGLFAPPDVDANQLAALRDAFIKMTQDEAWLKEMSDANQTVNALSGDELQQLILDIASSIPQAYLDLVSIS